MNRIVFLIITLFLSNLLLSQGKVERTNATYMNVDLDQTWKFIQWSKNSSVYKPITFNENRIGPDSCISIKLNSKFGGLQGKDLFYLDTIHREDRWFKFYASSKYFDSIRQIDLAFGSKKDGKQLLVRYSDLISEKKKSMVEFVNAMIQFGVIVTYHHINAEMVYQVTSNTSNETKIKYNVVWHYCTNDCYDPKYSFEVTIDKTTNSMYVRRL